MSVDTEDDDQGFALTEIPDPIISANTSLVHSTDCGLSKCPKVPPIFLRRIDNFVSTCQLLERLNINFRRAKPSSVAVKLHPPTVEDHIKLKDTFSKLKIPYHTYKLPEKPKLTVMLRGVSCKLSTEDVIVDLANKGLPVREVYRLRKGSDRIPIPIVKVMLDRTDEGKDVFSLKEICSKPVEVELPKKQGLRQCHRCQKYGHAERWCSAKVRCVKCAGEHWTHECSKGQDVPPQCANCSGKHTANYSGCVRRPTLRFTPMNRISSLSDKLSAIKWDLLDENVIDRWTYVLVKTVTRTSQGFNCPDYFYKKMGQNEIEKLKTHQSSIEHIATRLSFVGRPAKIKPVILTLSSDWIKEIGLIEKGANLPEVDELQKESDHKSDELQKKHRKKKSHTAGTKRGKGRRSKKRR